MAPTIQVADASAAGLRIKTMRTPAVSHLTVFRRRGLLFYQFDTAISRSSDFLADWASRGGIIGRPEKIDPTLRRKLGLLRSEVLCIPTPIAGLFGSVGTRSDLRLDNGACGG